MLRLFASTPVRNAAVTQAQRMVATQSVQTSTNLDVPICMNLQELIKKPEISRDFNNNIVAKHDASHWPSWTTIGLVPANRPEAISISLQQKYSDLTTAQRATVNAYLTSAEVVEWFRRTETLRSPLKMKEEEPAAPVKQEAKPVGLDRDTALAIVAGNDYSTVPIDLRAYVVKQLTGPEVVRWYKQATKRGPKELAKLSLTTSEVATQKAKSEELPTMSRADALSYIQCQTFASTPSETMNVVIKELTFPEVVAWRRQGLGRSMQQS